MSRCFVGVLLVLALAVPCRAQPTVEQTVVQLEKKWADANRTGDMRAIEELLAPDFVMTDQTGRVLTRAAYLAIFEKQRLQTSSASDFRVVAHGDAAVVLSVVEGKGVETSGSPVAFKVRVTDTWVRMREGNWQCIASSEVGIR